MRRIISLLLVAVFTILLLYLTQHKPDETIPESIEKEKAEDLADLDSLIEAGKKIREKEILDSLADSKRLIANKRHISDLQEKHDKIDLSSYTDPMLDSLGKVLYPDSIR